MGTLGEPVSRHYLSIDRPSETGHEPKGDSYEGNSTRQTQGSETVQQIAAYLEDKGL